MSGELLQGRRLKLAASEANRPPGQLGGLRTLAAVLASPLPLEQIATVVAEAALEFLDVQILVIAVHIDDQRHLRAVHVSGVPLSRQRRLAADPSDEASLVAEIQQLLGSPDSSRIVGPLEVLPIPQVLCPRGLIVAARLGSTRPFSDADRAFASVLAGICGLALDRLRLSSERSRARAALRSRPQAQDRTHLRVGDMEIDLVEHRISIGSRAATLTPSEFRLLMLLAVEPGRPRSRQEILQHLWHSEHVGDERACDVHISNLRRKLEQDPARPVRLVTVRGVGYALVARS